MYQYPCPSNHKYLEAASDDGITWTDTAVSEAAEMWQVAMELRHERCLNQLGVHLNALVVSVLAERTLPKGAIAASVANASPIPSGDASIAGIGTVFQYLVAALSQTLPGFVVAVFQPIESGLSATNFAVSHLAPLSLAPQQTTWRLPSGQTLQLESGMRLCGESLQYLRANVTTGVWQMMDGQTLLGWVLVCPDDTTATSPRTSDRESSLISTLVERAMEQCLTTLRQLRLMQTQQQQHQQLLASNQELTQANQLKSEFLANTSHEIRTPLSSILGFTHLLQAQGFNPTNPRHQEYLNIILTSGQHLLALINDILDLSKIEANQLDLQWEAVDVPRVCQMAMTLVREKANDKGLKLQLNVAPQIAPLFADPLRLKQMLFNLLSNAIKFTVKGSVGLNVTTSPPMLCFTVWDTGTGISEDQQRLLFRPYSQIPNAAAGLEQGTGLGLALTQKLAELHGGWIVVTSVINEGSQFTIFLPQAPPTETATPTHPADAAITTEPSNIAQGESAQTAATAARSPSMTDDDNAPCLATPADAPTPTIVPQSKRKVAVRQATLTAASQQISPMTEPPTAIARHLLLVEDNIHNAKLMLTFLSKLGYEISWVQSGREMWQALERSLPSLILMDIHLPGEDGMTLTRQLKRDPRYQMIPVIAQTAMAMKGDRDLCLEAGAADYISKPIDLGVLKTLVEKYIAS